MRLTRVLFLAGFTALAAIPSLAFASDWQSGTLLEASSLDAGSVGIVPVSQEIEYREAEPLPFGPNASMSDYDENNPPLEAEFHIINGPNASDHFTGRHYTAILYSRYKQVGARPLTQWIHYGHGPNESKFWKFVPGSN